jgi:hypothetical protein
MIWRRSPSSPVEAGMQSVVLVAVQFMAFLIVIVRVDARGA